MALDRKHIQDLVLKTDREIVKLLAQRVELFEALCAFPDDKTFDGKLIERAREQATLQDLDPAVVASIFLAMQLEFTKYTMNLQVDISINEFMDRPPLKLPVIQVPKALPAKAPAKAAAKPAAKPTPKPAAKTAVKPASKMPPKAPAAKPAAEGEAKK